MNEPCAYCNGQGRTTIMMRNAAGMQQATIRCAHCSGTGVIATPADPRAFIDRAMNALSQRVFR